VEDWVSKRPGESDGDYKRRTKATLVMKQTLRNGMPSDKRILRDLRDFTKDCDKSLSLRVKGGKAPNFGQTSGREKRSVIETATYPPQLDRDYTAGGEYRRHRVTCIPKFSKTLGRDVEPFFSPKPQGKPSRRSLADEMSESASPPGQQMRGVVDMMQMTDRPPLNETKITTQLAYEPHYESMRAHIPVIEFGRTTSRKIPSTIESCRVPRGTGLQYEVNDVLLSHRTPAPNMAKQTSRDRREKMLSPQRFEDPEWLMQSKAHNLPASKGPVPFAKMSGRDRYENGEKPASDHQRLSQAMLPNFSAVEPKVPVTIIRPEKVHSSLYFRMQAEMQDSGTFHDLHPVRGPALRFDQYVGREPRRPQRALDPADFTGNDALSPAVRNLPGKATSSRALPQARSRRYQPSSQEVASEISVLLTGVRKDLRKYARRSLWRPDQNIMPVEEEKPQGVDLLDADAFLQSLKQSPGVKV
jgi:hypothetical protein